MVWRVRCFRCHGMVSHSLLFVLKNRIERVLIPTGLCVLVMFTPVHGVSG